MHSRRAIGSYAQQGQDSKEKSKGTNERRTRKRQFCEGSILFVKEE